MTIRAIMVDVDGVLIVHPDERGWSAHLERDLGIPAATLQSAFFAVHWDDVIHGRAALRDRLTPVLRDIAPTVSSDALIDYWFAEDAHLDQALLAELASIRAEGVELHLATVQDHERARYLWDTLDFRSRFDGMHYAADLGVAKPDAGFYRSIEARTGFAPHELFFIDDKPANVAAARTAGWSAALWTGRGTLRALMRDAEPAPCRVRAADRADIAAMHAIRRAVTENPLSEGSGVTIDSYLAYVDAGSAWVVERDGAVLGFAALDEASATVWALFVSPTAERTGIGRTLHDAFLARAALRGLKRLRLATATGTRAERFYRMLGWAPAGIDPHGQMRFERSVDS